MNPSPEDVSLPPEVDVFVDLDAEPEAAWSAITTAEGLAPWMGTGSSIDVRPGGLVALPDPVGGATRRGKVDRIDDGRRLDFTWWPALRPADRTEVSITLEPITGGTRVRVVERRPVLARTAATATAPTVAAPSGTRPGNAAAPPRGGTARLPIGLWSWRLAVLTVATCLSPV